MVTEGFPFDSQTLVFKVAGKMFALLALDEHPLRMNVKCDPERAVALREEHASVLPGYHMNKASWNTLVLDGSLTRKWVEAEIDHSYDEVVKTLSKKTRETL
jgi:predicted DNA-binding protein (MmcQ/YjbR family)